MTCPWKMVIQSPVIYFLLGLRLSPSFATGNIFQSESASLVYTTKPEPATLKSCPKVAHNIVTKFAFSNKQVPGSLLTDPGSECMFSHLWSQQHRAGLTQVCYIEVFLSELVPAGLGTALELPYYPFIPYDVWYISLHSCFTVPFMFFFLCFSQDIQIK